MTISALVRWSGFMAMLGGLLFPVAALMHPNGEDLASVQMQNWVPAHLLGWIAVSLIHLGLVGLYTCQAKETGWLGLIGFLLAFVGTAFASTVQYVASTAIPLIATQAPELFDQATTPPQFGPPLIILGFVLGHVLFGLATMRAGVLPKWSGLMVMIGVTLFFLGELSFFGQKAPALQLVFDVIREWRVVILIGDAAFGLGLAWMGYALWADRRWPSEPADPAYTSRASG